MAENDKLYWTGNYAVAHFGTDDMPFRLPYFLIAEGMGDHSKFTSNLNRAALYPTRMSAEMVKDKRDEALGEINHPLHGRLSVVEIYVKKAVIPND